VANRHTLHKGKPLSVLFQMKGGKNATPDNGVDIGGYQFGADRHSNLFCRKIGRCILYQKEQRRIRKVYRNRGTNRGYSCNLGPGCFQPPIVLIVLNRQ
jgi:hypothetical protein